MVEVEGGRGQREEVEEVEEEEGGRGQREEVGEEGRPPDPVSHCGTRD